MVDEPERIPSLTKLGKLANNRKFDQLEDVWLPAVESGEYEAKDLMSIAGQVGRLGAEDRAVSLVWVLLSTTEEKSGSAAALAAARLAAHELPNTPALRDEIVRLYLAVHPDYPGLEELLELFADTPEPCDVNVATIDAYLPLRVGAFVKDASFLMPGVIEEVNVSNGVVTVRYEQRHQEYGRSSLGKIAVLPEDHFPALVIYEPDQLRDLAGQDAIAFILLALKASKERRLAYRDLKHYVIQLLGEKGWQSWWKKTRLALKRAPRIDVTSGSQPTLRLLNQARNYEERLRKEFDKLTDPIARLSLVLSYLGETSGNVVAGNEKAETAFMANEELLVYFGNGAAKLAVATLGEHPAIALAGLATHAEVAARGVPVAKPNPQAAAKVLGKMDDPGKLGQELPEALLLHTLNYLRVALPDRWPSVWAPVMIRAGRKTCDHIARALVAADHLTDLEDALVQVVARPTSSPDAICWLWRSWHASTTGKVLTGFRSLSASAILTSLLNLCDATGKLIAVSGDGRHRHYLEMAQNSLVLGEGRPVQAVFTTADRDEAVRFKALIHDNNGLTAARRGLLLGLLRAEYADLFVADDRSWEEDVIYTTETGLKRRQTELDEILKEDIPEVAKQIGVAAAFGDLSENAEFTAALEKRDQLTSRATAMESDLQLARIITADMAGSPFVNVGSRVVARDLIADQEETYTFLGPWDADIDRHILTYNAPVALAFMGKKVGDEVVYGEGEEQRRWEILSIEPGI